MSNKYILIVLLAWLIVSCSSSKTATVVVSNESGWQIKSLTIGVSGQKKTIKNLKNGDSTRLIFQGLQTAHYTLNGKLSDGSVIHGEYGYVTNGMEFSDSFVVAGGGKVEFKAGPH